MLQEWTSGLEGDKILDVGSLGALLLVEGLLGHVGTELQIHVPAHFLGTRLWHGELILRELSQRGDFGLQVCDVVLGLDVLVGCVLAGNLVGDAHQVLWVEVEVFLEEGVTLLAAYFLAEDCIRAHDVLLRC